MEMVLLLEMPLEAVLRSLCLDICFLDVAVFVPWFLFVEKRRLMHHVTLRERKVSVELLFAFARKFTFLLFQWRHRIVAY